jgi:hypothetical protein
MHASFSQVYRTNEISTSLQNLGTLNPIYRGIKKIMPLPEVASWL